MNKTTLNFSLLIIFISYELFGQSGATIWTGPDYTFTKESYSDWTLPENQDIIVEGDLIITRQNDKPIYNYLWFQIAYNEDATEDDLEYNFWKDNSSVSPTHTSMGADGGIKGAKFALLDDTGSTTDWSGFSFYGELGNPSNFYSLNNIVSIITELEKGNTITSVDDDFRINGSFREIDMSKLIGKKLGVHVWDSANLYFTLTFNSWGGEGTGGAVSYTRSTNQTLTVNNFEQKKEIDFFLDPYTNLIQLVGLTKPEYYKVYNISGAEIINGEISENEKIDIGNLTTGLYFLNISSIKTIKFLKN